MKSLAVKLLGAKYRYIFPQHVNYFTRATLERFSSAPSFELIYGGSMHFNPVVIWQDFRGKGAFVPDAERAALLKRTTALKQNRVMKPVKVVYRMVESLLGKLYLADNLFVVLRRK